MKLPELYFNKNFIKVDLIEYVITDGYIQSPGMCIINRDKIDRVYKSDLEKMYILYVGSSCYYITEDQFNKLCGIL